MRFQLQEFWWLVCLWSFQVFVLLPHLTPCSSWEFNISWFYRWAYKPRRLALYISVLVQIKTVFLVSGKGRLQNGDSWVYGNSDIRSRSNENMLVPWMALKHWFSVCTKHSAAVVIMPLANYTGILHTKYWPQWSVENLWFLNTQIKVIISIQYCKWEVTTSSFLFNCVSPIFFKTPYCILFW